MSDKRTYGAPPWDLGVQQGIYLPEHMSYLYLPVRMAQSLVLRERPEETNDIRLPANLECLRAVVEAVTGLYAKYTDYVYVTAKRGYGIQSRPGWHTDGFGTGDINVLWSRGLPTQFALGEFGDVPKGHSAAMRHFTDVIDGKIDTAFSAIATYPDQSLLVLDQYVVHRAPEPTRDLYTRAEIAEPRQFVKISISKKKFNLEGNSHNYLFDYDWKMYPREDVRNMENREEQDYVDPRMLP